MVEPVCLDVRRKGFDDLSGAWVAAGVNARVLGASGWRRPYEILHHQQVLGRLVTRLVMGSGPKKLSRFGVEGPHGAVTAGEQDDVLVKNELGSEIEVDFCFDRADC